MGMVLGWRVRGGCYLDEMRQETKSAVKVSEDGYVLGEGRVHGRFSRELDEKDVEAGLLRFSIHDTQATRPAPCE